MTVTKVQGIEPLVKNIAWRMHNHLPPHICIDDLLQSGMEGWLTAKARYNREHGASFYTYASIRVRGAILDSLREGNPAGRRIYKDKRALDKVFEKLENKHTNPSHAQAAEELQIPIDEYHKMICEMQSMSFVPLSDEIDVASEERSAYEQAEQHYIMKELNDTLEALPERDQMLVQAYYGDDGMELGMRAIGKIIGVSESRVSQLLKEAIKFLRSQMKERWM